MKKTFSLIGATAGGTFGWYAGALVSGVVAFILSMIGTGIGMYAGIRTAQRYY